MKVKQTGSVFDNHGLWYYSVKLPGEKTRRQVPLKAPGATHTLTTDRPRSMAEQAAARWWEEHTRQQPKRERTDGTTVGELCAAWGAHALEYYRRADGTPTSEAAQVTIGVRLFRDMYARATLKELRHADLLRWRDAVERSGVARVTVNRRIGILRRMLAWALDEGLIDAATKAELSQLSTLKRGRSKAHECEPVRAVDDAAIAAACQHMMPNTADMVRVHRLTGMRPEEMCALRFSAIDQTATPWVYRPDHHKNEWRGELGYPRVVLIGPKARAILERHRGAGDFPFSPVAAVAEWMDAKRAARTSPFYPSRDENYTRANPHTPRRLGQRWNTNSYTKTIAAACRRASIPSWGANRLRHAFGTQVRRAYGLDAARAVLGHNDGGCVTDIYTFEAIEEETINAARTAVEALG